MINSKFFPSSIASTPNMSHSPPPYSSRQCLTTLRWCRCCKVSKQGANCTKCKMLNKLHFTHRPMPFMANQQVTTEAKGKLGPPMDVLSPKPHRWHTRVLNPVGPNLFLPKINALNMTTIETPLVYRLVKYVGSKDILQLNIGTGLIMLSNL